LVAEVILLVGIVEVTGLACFFLGREYQRRAFTNQLAAGRRLQQAMTPDNIRVQADGAIEALGAAKQAVSMHMRQAMDDA
jgi:hypothetical protein